MRVLIHSILFCAIFLSLLSGCGRCCNNCFRRPPVMEKMEPCVLDYSEICDKDMFKRQDSCNRLALTQEMFNPYSSFSEDHRISIGDILDITIIGEDIVSTEQYIVAPDGKVYYSLTRTGVDAAGRTPAELGNDISLKLKHLFTEPVVTVVPKVSKGLSFKVLGRVRQPGVYPLMGPITIREALGMAGGLYSRANSDLNNSGNRRDSLISLEEPIEDLSLSYIVRGDKKLDIDFVSLIESPDSKQNVYLRPGDFIFIAPSEDYNVFVLGAVPFPQRVPFTRGLTLMSVLADAGVMIYPGPYTANLQKILVLRGALECPCVMQVDIMQILNGQARDLYVQPGDIIYAQDKPYRLGRELVYIAVNAFIQSFSATAASYYADRHWFPPKLLSQTGAQ